MHDLKMLLCALNLLPIVFVLVGSCLNNSVVLSWIGGYVAVPMNSLALPVAVQF